MKAYDFSLVVLVIEGRRMALIRFCEGGKGAYKMASWPRSTWRRHR